MPAIIAPSTLYGRRSSVCFAVIGLLLTVSGDAEFNPDPTKFPCGKCHKPVRSNQRGIYCDQCNNMRCASITVIEYRRHAHSSRDSMCTGCHIQANIPQQQRQQRSRL